MKKYLHKKFGWFNCFDSFWLRITSVDRVELNESHKDNTGVYVNLSSRCNVCGSVQRHFQTRDKDDIPQVGDVLYPAYLFRQ